MLVLFYSTIWMHNSVWCAWALQLHWLSIQKHSDLRFSRSKKASSEMIDTRTKDSNGSGSFIPQVDLRSWVNDLSIPRNKAGLGLIWIPQPLAENGLFEHGLIKLPLLVHSCDKFVGLYFLLLKPIDFSF